MRQLISQPIAENEPWFPSNLHDYVLLPDGMFGQVVIQTPEFVQIKSGGMIRTFLIGDFLNLGIKNLSMGSFACVENFGLSLEHQRICLDQVPGAFSDAIKEKVEELQLGVFLEEVRVELSSVRSASIQYFLLVKMRSPAAEYYWRLRRKMQQACVATCNREGWSIMNTEMIVNLPPPQLPHK
jgi:hypothetical protein